jgi:leucyl aminopeptidase (aminopeptidase T)
MGMMSELAYKIVNIVLGVERGQVVSIGGEIHNDGADLLTRSTEALAEIPLIEELAIMIRKKQAFPVIEISTDNLKKRFLNEMPDDIYDLPLDYYTKWVDTIDAFIDIGWRSNPGFFQNLADWKFNKLKASTSDILQSVIHKNKKMLFLGYPTRAVAEYFEADPEVLKAAYFEGLNCDYNKVMAKTDDLTRRFTGLENGIAFTGENHLVFSIDQERLAEMPKWYNNNLIVLPGGQVEIPLLQKGLTGIFRASRVYHENLCFENVEIHIGEGEVYAVQFETDRKGNNKLRHAAINHHCDFRLCVGLNENLRELTGYYLFDEAMLGNVSLKLYDQNGREIIFSNPETRMQTGEQNNILGEVLYV